MGPKVRASLTSWQDVGKLGLRRASTPGRRHHDQDAAGGGVVDVDVDVASEAAAAAIEGQDSQRQPDDEDAVVDGVEVGRVDAQAEAVAIFRRSDFFLRRRSAVGRLVVGETDAADLVRVDQGQGGELWKRLLGTLSSYLLMMWKALSHW